MFNPIVLMRGDDILFRTTVDINLPYTFDVSLESFLSVYGLAIPLSSASLLTIFKLHGKMLFGKDEVNTELIDLMNKDHINEMGALIIDKFGNIYTLYNPTISPLSFRSNYIIRGDDVKWVKTMSHLSTDITKAVIECNDTLDGAFTTLCNIAPITSKDAYRIYSLTELTMWISACLKSGIAVPYTGKITIPSILKEYD